MEIEQDTIRFGDYIALYSEYELGYIAGDCTSEMSNEPIVYSRQSYDLPENVATMSMLLFEVCVVHRYKMDKRYRKMLELEDPKLESVERLDKLKKLKEAVALEVSDNDQVMKRNTGQPLRFGDIIQLRHVFSGYFIHMNSNKLSEIQKSAFKTILLPYSAKSAQFQVVPKYKVDLDGSKVIVGAYIALESIASRSYYFHTNPNPFHPSSDQQPGLSELNVSLEKHGFVVYKSRQKKEEKSCLSGLDLIHFYHQESEAYLTAEGYFFGKVTEKLHMRIRKIDLLDVRTLTPSTNSNTYWEIEKAQQPYSTDSIRWNDLVRIKHGSTRLYISLNNSNRLFLTSNIHDPRNVFKFHPVNKDREEFIRKGINVRVEHVLSGSWLKVTPHYEYIKEEYSNHTHTSLNQVIWDNASLVKVSMDTDQQYDDAFNIEEVAGANAHIFHKICGFVPLILSLQDKLCFQMIRNPDCVNDESLIRYYRKGIEELTNYIYSKNKPNKNRQKLLRCTKIIDILFNVIDNYSQLSMQSQDKWRRPFQAIFYLIHCYIGTNCKNTEYLARYFRVLSDPRWRTSCLITEVVSSLCRMVSSSARIAEQIEAPHIEAVIDLVRESQNPVFLKFLGQACANNNIPIFDNQDSMTQNWLVNDKTGLYLIKDGQEIGYEKNELYVSTNSGKNWVSIHKFFDKSESIYNRQACDFLLEQLEFFKALTLGRNAKVIKIITEDERYITLPMVLTCLKNEKLPDEFRAKFCKLVINLFLSHGPNYTVIELPIMSYMYDNVRGQSKHVLKVQQKLDDSIYILNDWILGFIVQNGNLSCQNVTRNQLMVQLLELLKNLIKFGYFDHIDSLQHFITPIINVLDGSNDVKFNPTTWQYGLSNLEREELQKYHYRGRFEQFEDNNVLVEAKNAALEVLELLLMFQLNTRIESLVKLFKQYRDSYQKQQQLQLVQKKNGDMTFYTYLFEPNLEVSKLKAYSTETKTLVDSMNELMENSKYFYMERVETVLLDLAQYKYDSLLHKSLLLLTKIFSSQGEVFIKCQDIMITYHQDSDIWLDMIQEFVPQLEILISSDWSKTVVNNFTSIVQTIKSHCTLPNSDLPNFVFQKICYSSSLVNVLVKVFEKECGTKSSFAAKNSLEYRRISKVRVENKNKINQMYGETLDCLKTLAKEMKGVQNELFGNLETLMSLSEQNILKQIELIRVIFADREDLVENVPVNTIEWLFKWITKYLMYAPEIINLILCLGRVQYSFKLVRNNLVVIMKLLMKYWHNMGLLAGSSCEEKIEVLEKTEDCLEKKVLLRTIYLMGVGSEMDLEYVESFCQSVLSLDDCLRIIIEVDDFMVHRSLLKFIAEAYIRSENSSKQYEYIMTDMQFWRAIEIIRDTNADWLPKIREMSSQTQYDTLLAISDEENLHSEECVYLAWLIDGVLPFMKQLLRSTNSGPITITQEQLMIENVKLILQILNELTPNLTSLHQIELVTGFLFSSVLSNYERYMSLEPIIAQLATNVRADSNNEQRSYREFMSQHREEIQMNHEFRLFLNNCQSIFVGDNNVAQQIIYPSPIEGMDTISKLDSEEYTKMSTAEELPLGKEFQTFVLSFLKLEEKQPEKRYSNLKCIVRHLRMQLPRISTRPGFTANKIAYDQDYLNMACFRVLRAVIHNEIERLPSNWPQHMNDSHISGQLLFIRQLQSALCDLDLFESVLHHASRVKSPVTIELFAFLKVLLFNASTSVQENIYQFFIVSVTETFFFAIKEFLAIFENDIKTLRRTTNTKLKQAYREQNQFRVRRQTLTNMDLTVYFECKEYFQDIEKLKSETLDNIRTLRFNSMIENGFGILLMQVLQSLCEGQFVKLQDYMRVQEDNPKSFNLVFRTCSMIGSLYAHVNDITIGILTQGFGAINQMTIGNQDNRVTLINSKVIDYANFILRNTEFNGASPSQVLDLREMVVTLLINLIEENGGASQELAKEIMITVDKKAILNIILQYYQMSKKDCLPNLDSLTTFVAETKPKKGVLANLGRKLVDFPAFRARKIRKMAPIKERIFSIGYLYTSVILRFIDLDANLMDKLMDEDVTSQHKAAFKAFRKAGRSIELIKDDTIQRVHFRIKNPAVIREDLIETIKWDVDRSSSASKLRDFSAWSESVIMDLETSKKANPIKSFLIQSWYLWNYLPVIISVVINIMMLITFESEYSLSDGPLNSSIYIPFPKLKTDPPLHLHMMYFATIHSVLSLILLITYILISKPGFENVKSASKSLRGLCKRLPASETILINHNVNRLKKARQKIDMMTENDKAEAVIDYQKLKRFLEEQCENNMDDNNNGISTLSDVDSDPSNLQRSKNKLEINFISMKTGYYFLFFLCSLIGTIFGGYLSTIYGLNYYIAYYLFAFHLIHIALIVTDLTGVFLAIRQSLPSMAWVGLLILIIIYSFNIILFVFFRDSTPMSNNLYCDTLGHCYVTLIRFGFIFDKWHELFLPQFESKKNFNDYLYLAIFTLLLFVIVGIIMLNIISGIIVDKFASIRNLKNSKVDDMHNYCFICGRSSYEFETVAKGFRYHIMREHNMWAYLYFVISLQTIKIRDFTALQWHVHKMFKRKNLDFFPIDRALALTQSTVVTEQEKLRDAHELLNSIIDDMDNSKVQKEQIQRKTKQEQWKKEAIKAKGPSSTTSKLSTASPGTSIYQTLPSFTFDLAGLDSNYMMDTNVQFCPSTNINSIPINMITFEMDDLSPSEDHHHSSDEDVS